MIRDFDPVNRDEFQGIHGVVRLRGEGGPASRQFHRCPFRLPKSLTDFGIQRKVKRTEVGAVVPPEEVRNTRNLGKRLVTKSYVFCTQMSYVTGLSSFTKGREN